MTTIWSVESANLESVVYFTQQYSLHLTQAKSENIALAISMNIGKTGLEGTIVPIYAQLSIHRKSSAWLLVCAAINHAETLSTVFVGRDIQCCYQNSTATIQFSTSGCLFLPQNRMRFDVVKIYFIVDSALQW